jgi:hypothetical protein
VKIDLGDLNPFGAPGMVCERQQRLLASGRQCTARSQKAFTTSTAGSTSPSAGTSRSNKRAPLRQSCQIA